MIASLKLSNSICDEQVDQKPSTALANFNLGGGAPFESLDLLHHGQKPRVTSDLHMTGEVPQQNFHRLRQELTGMPEVKRRRTEHQIDSHGRNEVALIKIPTRHTTAMSAC